MNEKVSVIVPIYNMEECLQACVNSIQNQTHSNIEIILIDDGSTDDSFQLCKVLSETDERIISVSQENSGVSVARNVGIETASGEWIMFVDPDDILDEKIISTLLSCISSNVDIVSCCCKILCNGEVKLIDHFFDGDCMFFNNNEKKILYLQLSDYTYAQPDKAYTAIGVPWGKLYRTSFLKKNGLFFDKSLPRMQDNIFNMYAFNCAEKIIYIDQPLYIYNIEHVNFYQHRGYNPKFAKALILASKARWKCIYDTNLFKDKDIFDACRKECFNNYIYVLKNWVMSRENNVAFPEKKEIAEKLASIECFKNSLDYKPKGFKYVVCFNLLKKKRYLLFILICRVYDMIKDRIIKLE